VIDRRELEQRNDAIQAEHRAAVERGEERVLRLTRTGELHSYAPDEIGLGEVSAGPQVTSWWGLTILTMFFVALFAASWLIIFAPVAEGHAPAWGGLVVTLMSAPGALYMASLAREQYRARAVRRRRGAPEPSDSPVPYRWRDRAPEPRPRAPHPRARRWRKRPWWWVVARGLLAGFLALGMVGTLLEPDPDTVGVLWTTGAGLLLTVALPVALAARRVRNAGV
jgi:quinol-cytochrome oxidoreductase complex cytochrome b subunit